MQENDRCEKASQVSDLHGPQQIKNTCMKTMHKETTDRRFTVLESHSIVFYSQLHISESDC